MLNLNQRQKAYLSAQFKTRVSFDRFERKVYSHDVGELPGLIKPLVGSTLAGAVVQPEAETEVIDLILWAGENRVPLVPRGKATSGYGGVLPVKNSIVIDFYRMNKLLSVDKDKLEVTVQPGIIWEKLQKQLEAQHLMLRLYPTSYPSSTVGGWVAQGGAGIGSFHAGWFDDNLVRVKTVQANGTVRIFEHKDLDLVYEAEGITGLITAVTLKVMPLEALHKIAFAAPDLESLQNFAAALISESVPLWSFSFINPRMVQLKNRVPLKTQHGHAAEKKVILPEKYICLLVYTESDKAAVSAAATGLALKYELEPLPGHIAEHEWENRFKLMIIKRLGPSLVPAEIVLPLTQLKKALTEIEKKVKQPVVKEGILIQKGKTGAPEIVILGFIPGDQRKFRYNLIFGLVLSIMKIAVKYGGRPYATGKYFAAKADKILGKEKKLRLAQFKKTADPGRLLNPGKVLKGGLVGLAINLAWFFEPLIKLIGNRVNTETGERLPAQKRQISGDLAWYAYSCSQCGYCVPDCDQFYGRGWESQSPRGKWYWIREYLAGREKWNQQVIDTFLVCTTCEMCNSKCSAALPIEESWMKLRGKLIHEEKRMTFPPFEMMSAALTKEGDIWAGYRKDRTAWFPEDLKEEHLHTRQAEAVYFAGCTASYVEHDIGMASVRLLHAADVNFTHLGTAENCCGTPMLVAGKWDVFLETMNKNIQAVLATGAKTVISSCPACDMMWRHVYPQWAKKTGQDYPIQARHYSEVLAEKIKSGAFKFPANGHKQLKVTWHDSCHIGRASKVYEPPRDILKAVPGVSFRELLNNREEAHCCGSVVTLIKEPGVAADIGAVKIREAQEVGADKIIALCPCCEFQLRVAAEKKKLPVQVEDLAHFAASALGYTFPDPHPEVQKQWAVFEAMIKLMTPQGFAGLMAGMFPELVAAMPLGMGKMMRGMAKIPGMTLLMKPLFPLLFPLLLPGMMPKVMDKMLTLVQAQIPMPDYMAAQMPALMPGVMRNLMPHMLKVLVPLVADPLLAYLKKA